MNLVSIKVGDDDIKLLQEIFNDHFTPLYPEDRVIIEILKQVLENPKMKIIKKKLKIRKEECQIKKY
jgi:hypothetical protein